MLERTFQHLPGIGPRGEERLWNTGIKDWNAFLKSERIDGIRTERKIMLDRWLRADRMAFERGEWNRFCTWPLRLHHRALPHLERIVYLDIETYGVKDHRVAIIALSDGVHVRLLNGFCVDRSLIEPILNDAEAIVTYNGSRFDLPYLTRAYHLRTDAFVIDLEPLARRAGYIGGLKHIETQLGIERARTLRSGDPLALWRAYRASADEHYLELLTEYVEQDVLTLPILLDRLIPSVRTS
jgi:uncharacterized protein